MEQRVDLFTGPLQFRCGCPFPIHLATAARARRAFYEEERNLNCQDCELKFRAADAMARSVERGLPPLEGEGVDLLDAYIARENAMQSLEKASTQEAFDRMVADRREYDPAICRQILVDGLSEIQTELQEYIKAAQWVHFSRATWNFGRWFSELIPLRIGSDRGEAIAEAREKEEASHAQ